MGNSKKGEVSFAVAGDRWTLRYTIDALCRLESELDRTFASITAELQDIAAARLSTVRAVFWAGLVEHHPDLTVKQAGELMLAMGGTGAALTEIGKALAAAFPEAADGENPRMPDQDGTGPASTSSTPRSATSRNRSGG